MKNTPCGIILSIVFFALFQHSAEASPKISDELVKSAVMLQSPDGRCASGFITVSGEIVTNAHVVASLCKGVDCNSLKIKRAPTVDSPPGIEIESQSLRVKRLHNAVDLAVLEVTPPAAGALQISPNAIATTTVYSLGFPKCKNLELSAGQVMGKDSLRVFTSTQGAHGSSGSALLDDEFKLVGVVNQAGSLLDGIAGFIAGVRFSNKAVPITAVDQLLKLPPTEAWDESARMLLSFYLQGAAKTGKLQRLRFGFDFSAAIKGLSRDALSLSIPEADAAPLFFLDSEISLLPQFATAGPANFRRELAEKLFAAHSLELRGPRDDRFRDVDETDLLSRIPVASRSEQYLKDLKGLLLAFKSDNYPGFYVEGLSIIAFPLILLIVIVLLWSSSLGFVFAKAQGSLFHRAIVTLLVAVCFWPISLIVYLIKSSRRKAI